MTLTTSDFIALLTLMLWPAVPLFWVPVHCQPRFFKRLGFITYALPLVTWLPAVYLVYLYRLFLLEFTVPFPLVVNIAGAMSLILGIALQSWTLMLLKLPVIMGMPEVLSSVRSELITAGPFCVVRHPTYLSHTLMLLGVLLLTGVAAVGIAMLIDLLVVNLVIIPLEEKELSTRFGTKYEQYRQKVPFQLVPRLHRRGDPSCT